MSPCRCHEKDLEPDLLVVVVICTPLFVTMGNPSDRTTPSDCAVCRAERKSAVLARHEPMMLTAHLQARRAIYRGRAIVKMESTLPRVIIVSKAADRHRFQRIQPIASVIMASSM